MVYLGIDTCHCGYHRRFLCKNELVWGWIWTVAYAPFAYTAWKRYCFYIADTMLVASKGSISHRKVMISLRKIQGVSVRQSIWQKKGKRANVSLYMTLLSQINAAKAYALKNLALYLPETLQEAWM